MPAAWESAPLVNESPAVDPSLYRADGSLKGQGFLGPLPFHDGRTSTELSIGVNIGGKETDIPSLVPTLTNNETQWLLQGNKATPAIVQKAVDFAQQRIKQGKSVFANSAEGDYQQTSQASSQSPSGLAPAWASAPLVNKAQSNAEQPGPDLTHQLVRQGGIIGRSALTGVASLPLAVADVGRHAVNKLGNLNQAITGQEQSDYLPQSYRELFQRGLVEMGGELPGGSQLTNAEALRSAVTTGATGAAGGIGIGEQMALSAKSVVAGVGDVLRSAPAAQVVAGGGAGGSAELARQQGYGEIGQTLAGLAGGLGGGVAAQSTLPRTASASLPRGAATTAQDANSIRQVAAEAEQSAQQGASTIGLDWSSLDDSLKSLFVKNAEDALHTGSDLPPEAIVRKALYESVGIKPTRALITRSFNDALTEQNLLTEPEGQALRNVYIQNNQAIRNQIQQLTPEGVAATDQPTFGAQFREPIATGERAAQAASNEAYTAAQAAEGGNNADISRINAFLQDNAGTLDNRPASAGLTADLRKMGLMRTEAASAEMNPSSPQFTLQKLASARAAVNEAWQTAKANGDQRAVGRLNELRGILDETEANAGGDMYKAYRQIRTAKGGAYENNPLIDKLLSDQKGYVGTAKIEDSQVFDAAVLNSSTEQFGKTWPLLTSKAKDLTRAQLGKYIEDKTFSNMGMNESGDVVASAAKLNRAIDSINPQKLALIYGKDKAAQLDRLNQAVKEISNPPRGTVPQGSAPKLQFLYRNAIKLLGLAGKIPGLNVIVDVAEKRSAAAANQRANTAAINLMPANQSTKQPLLQRLEPVSPLLLPATNR